MAEHQAILFQELSTNSFGHGKGYFVLVAKTIRKVKREQILKNLQ